MEASLSVVFCERGDAARDAIVAPELIAWYGRVGSCRPDAQGVGAWKAIFAEPSADACARVIFHWRGDAARDNAWHDRACVFWHNPPPPRSKQTGYPSNAILRYFFMSLLDPVTQPRLSSLFFYDLRMGGGFSVFG